MESRKSEIIQKASSLFGKYGYKGTTIRSLATELGMQSGSLFHYFGSKEELLALVMEESLKDSIESIKLSISPEAKYQEKLFSMIRAELEKVHNGENSGWRVLFSEWRHLEVDSKRRLLSLRAEYNAIWLNVFREGERAGFVVVAPDLLRRLSFGALYWTTTWYDKEGEMDVDQLARHIYSFLVK
jgi:AcrR family transcriptional regulator